jgi:hypothetical protein
MEQRVGAKKIKILGVGMSVERRKRPIRDGRPVEAQASEMGLLQFPPKAQAVQPAFEPVMMPCDEDEEDEKECEYSIPGLIPSELIQGDGRRSAGEEDHEPPPCEARAGRHCLVDPARETA